MVALRDRSDSLRRRTWSGYIPTTMPRSAFLRAAAASALLLTTATVACRQPRAAAVPPSAEFLVTAGDSAFWVRTDDGHLRVRRAPLTLANVGGRFYELYVADDDRSYFDALLVGQRIFRRDLLSGDSLQVFEDARVARIARAYAAAHPHEELLEDDEEGSDDPHTVATSDAELLDVVGPFLSYEHHRDVDIVNTEDSHIVRHGVIDLRDGTDASLRHVFGDTAAHRLVADGRAAYDIVIDSVRRSSGARGRRAARALGAFRFDSTSYAIEEIDGAPTVSFYVPGQGPSGGGLELPLPHVRAPEPPWWDSIRATVPTLGTDSLSEIWSGTAYDVVARYDTSGEFATLVVRDSARHEWAAARLPTPARRVYRLDAPGVDSASLLALARAFDESTLYSGTARTVRGRARPRSPVVLTTSNGSSCARSLHLMALPGAFRSNPPARATRWSCSSIRTGEPAGATATPGISGMERRRTT